MSQKFAELLKRRWPELLLLEAKRGDYLYGRDCGSVRIFAFLQLSEREDSFTINVGWSQDREWPATAFKITPPAVGDGKTLDAAWFRLGRLWNASADDEWWKLGSRGADVEVLLAKVPAVVASAVDRLEQYGIPYLKKVSGVEEWAQH